MDKTQVLTRLAAAFALAYLLSGFMHSLVTVAVMAFHAGGVGRSVSDAGIYVSFIASETIEAPLSGGFLKEAGNDGDATYINLYPFIAPIFIVFYFCFSRGWRWLYRPTLEHFPQKL